MLPGESSTNPTSLDFGPDNRLYVAQVNGLIYAYTISRDGPNDYVITSTEVIDIVKNQTPNYDDDGTPNSEQQRQVTGIFVTGTATNPILYVSSSDWRHGAGGGGADMNLDTNSGIVHRVTKNGNSWDKVDLVRGFARAEENHSVNGLIVDPFDSNILYLAVSGNTNAGAPSNNFAFCTEFANATAIVKIDLAAIDAMPVNTMDIYGYTYKWVYDFPTVDDPTRENVNGQDPNDPFGGNDGLNQAKLDPNGPVQIHSPGWRNVYDLLITTTPGQEGRMYAVDNGANPGWGGHPDGEADYPGEALVSSVTNNYIVGEPGSNGVGPGGDPMVNNQNGLHYIRELEPGDLNYVQPGELYYAGHPNPIRANPAGAGLYTKGAHTVNPNDTSDGYWRHEILSPDDPNFSTQSLPVDWPPVPLEMANPAEGDFRNSGETDGAIANYGPSTNGICEYTASNLGGSYKGNLLLIGYNSPGPIFRVILSEDGKVAVNCPDNTTVNCNSTFASGFGDEPLDVIAQGDNDVFPGTVWAVTYGSGNIHIWEPTDFDGGEVPVCEGSEDPNIDSDGDGFTNADELQNLTNPCAAGSKPKDNDGDFISDLLDPDDDNDGIDDIFDSFALDNQNGMNTNLPIDLELFNNQGYGIGGMGLTGLMTNGSTDYLNQYDADDLIGGGTSGLLTVPFTSPGDAAGTNNQDNGFQFGVNVSEATGIFTASTKINGPFFNGIAPTNYQSQGFYIGTGDQDNYLKLILNANGGSGGLQVLYESNGITNSSVTFNIPGLLSSTSLKLFLTIDPVNGTVQPKYAVDDGSINDLGNIIPLNGKVLEAVKGNYLINGNPSSLAVGTICTSFENQPPFVATWDYFSVQFGEGSNEGTNQAPEANAGQDQQIILPTDSITLTGLGSDPDGTIVGFNWSQESGPNTPILGGSDTNILSISNLIAGTYEFKFTVMDDGGGSATDNVIVTVNSETTGEEFTVLYRVNVGGPNIAATDSPNPDWALDNAGSPSPYLVEGGNNIFSTTGVNTNHSSLQGLTIPTGIFETERWDAGEEPEMNWSFPVDPGEEILVRLYFAEIYNEITASGQRVFDVSLEGIIPASLNDIDPFSLTGLNGGFMLEANAEVDQDGSLNIEFIHGTQNPNIKAIEILGINAGPNPIMLTSIGNQNNIEGESPILAVAATGGSANLNYSAFGLPPGLGIESTNGQITGVISVGASTNSPYQVIINIDDGGLNQSQSTEFTWVVTTDSGGGDPLEVAGIANQSDEEGASVSLNVVASNGVGNYSYSASGLPDSLSINTGTGLISGTIAAGASTSSPFAVTVTVNDDNDEVTENFTWAVTAGSSGGDVLIARINAGETTVGDEYIDGSGNVWSLDTYSISGVIYPDSPIGDEILETEDDFLYQTERSGTEGWEYEIPVPEAGTYRVHLHFAEIWWNVGTPGGGPGARTFDISLEGNVMLNDYDILSQVAAATAIIETVEVEVTDGVLNIAGIPVNDQAKIAAIEVWKVDNSSSRVASSIKEVEEKSTPFEFDVYPNPTSGEVTIEIKSLPTDSGQYSIFNSLGQRVFEEKFTGDLIKSINMNDYGVSSGLFLIRVSIYGKSNSLKKVVFE
ncbi:MAG: putative Ig domain-containing protein [Flammeovirgaceae bacterium]|nr:putative Ig domain-containing protein [Flammeovirgaceae bacterium]